VVRRDSSATSVDEVLEALGGPKQREHPVFFLGGGSNLLISDDGFRVLVIQLDLRGITVASLTAGYVMVKVAAGEPWDRFASSPCGGWAGIECLSGIRIDRRHADQNVGAYGREVGETVARVEVLDRTTRHVVWLTKKNAASGIAPVSSRTSSVSATSCSR
jgi:UDP-N-acetylmuramate dehydrogenase